MGHYSLWPVFQLFGLESPISVESRPSHLCTLNGNVAVRIQNDYSFPAACTIRFRFAAKGDRPPLDLFWYDGSMKPPTPEELEADNKELDPEGMLFVGDKGKILAGFLGDGARLIPEEKMRAYRTDRTGSDSGRDRRRPDRSGAWVSAFRGGSPTYGDFRLAGPITDAFNLAAVSLRMGGKRLLFDAASGRVRNVPEANKYLTRQYREGWELQDASA